MICNECNQNVALEYLGSNEFIFSIHHEPNTSPHRRCALSCDTLCVGTGDIISYAYMVDYASSDEKLDASPAFHVGESFWTDDSEVELVSCNHV